MKEDQFDEETINMINQDAIDALSGIVKLHVCKYASDASSASNEGATLLGISKVDNDTDGDGFRYLIGLREGVKITPHLSCFF